MILQAGSRVGVNEIVAHLGRGGMGDLYRARDTRLGREVALKLLPREMAANPDLVTRFALEARSASALNHPNIVTIFDIGEHEGVPFIAMELVDGRTLRELLREGGLERRTVLHLAAQLAEGLAAAHERGIVHRDVKPENLMVTSQWLLKILDFGLAKLLEPPHLSSDVTLQEPDALTRPGSIVGTAGYMAPEQVRGRPADARSDLFAVGCVLYEMLTSRRAFAGESPLDTLAMILREEPQLAVPGLDAEPELRRIVARCLEKDPGRRPESARALAAELRALTSSALSGVSWHSTASGAAPQVRRTPRPGSHADSVAVVPFVNAGADPATEYLSDGITEQLINSLSRIQKVRVLPRSTMFRFKGTAADPLEVGRHLGARLVLTGRVLQLGETLNVQAELLDVGEESQLWGEQYVRRLQDLFAVQQEIAGQIADKLRVELTGEQRVALARAQTDDAEAYRLYLKGRYFWNKRTAEGLRKAVAHLRAAIERDPGYALAWAGLADAYNNLGSYAVVPPAQAFPRAQAAARQALELDASLAEPHASLAFAAQYHDWEWEEAEREYREALERNPSYATAHHWYGWLLICQGRFEEAERSMRHALRLDPLSLPITTNLGFCHYFARRFEAAREQFARALEVEPEFAEAHRGLGETAEQAGDLEGALAHYRRALEASGGSAEVLAATGRALGRAGRAGEAAEVLGRLEAMARERYISAHEPAAVLIGLGRLDEALDRLEGGVEERSYKLVYLRVDPDLDPLRPDARFAGLLRAVRLA